MIRPVDFGFNPETAVNNAFQVAGADPDVQVKAAAEFDTMVEILRSEMLDVTVVPDTADPHTPDSIFPNNWISFHENGTVCLFPMFAENRRRERKSSVIDVVNEKFVISKTIDFSYYEEKNQFLEGTGSMVLDRVHKIAYACLSPRTNLNVLEVFCNQMGYRTVAFLAEDAESRPVYHTNVMMCASDPYIIVCMASLPRREDRDLVLSTIKSSGRELFEISTDQMNHFAGNMLQVHNRKGEKLLIMSTQALRSLHPKQVKKLSAHNRIIDAELGTVESYGGGSARCMIAEIHLQPKLTM
jgi:hypothetical protein